MSLKRFSFATLTVISILFGYALIPVCANEKPALGQVSPGNHVFQVSVNGTARRYVIHIPPNYSETKNWPVVFMFHGGGGTAKGAMRDTGWAEKADKEGFLAVFPEGTPPDTTRPGRFRDNPQTWNDGSNRSNVGAVERHVADVEFVSAILAELKARFKVDESRIYATGFSNGASICFRLARELSRNIAAVAPVAGSDWLPERKPERAVPILYITGTADPLNPVRGGEIRIGGKSFGEKPSTETIISRWVKLHGYPEKPRVIYDKDGAKGIAYGPSADVIGVVLYTIEGHGHHWPGGKSVLPRRLAGKNTARINATDVIWEFFKSHPRVEKNPDKQVAPADATKPHR